MPEYAVQRGARKREDFKQENEVQISAKNKKTGLGTNLDRGSYIKAYPKPLKLDGGGETKK